mmetsp:Transcript_36305/g.117373  ORF Transcript_36305/g.117373 Transcript_36305/m.117373 type:complete len:252 (-) Transcript_36305:936-1691(-)
MSAFSMRQSASMSAIGNHSARSAGVGQTSSGSRAGAAFQSSPTRSVSIPAAAAALGGRTLPALSALSISHFSSEAGKQWKPRNAHAAAGNPEASARSARAPKPRSSRTWSSDPRHAANISGVADIRPTAGASAGKPRPSKAASDSTLPLSAAWCTAEAPSPSAANQVGVLTASMSLTKAVPSSPYLTADISKVCPRSSPRATYSKASAWSCLTMTLASAQRRSRIARRSCLEMNSARPSEQGQPALSATLP